MKSTLEKNLFMESDENLLVKKMLLAGETKPALTLLRQSGISQVESIKFVRRVLDLPLVEAKEIVHLSSAYADFLERNEQLHDDIEAGFLKASND